MLDFSTKLQTTTSQITESQQSPVASHNKPSGKPQQRIFQWLGNGFNDI
jgi:hypothetical protein